MKQALLLFFALIAAPLGVVVAINQIEQRYYPVGVRDGLIKGKCLGRCEALDAGPGQVLNGVCVCGTSTSTS